VRVCASGSAARSWSHANDIAGKKRACPQNEEECPTIKRHPNQDLCWI
jgi:hypothetical protein